MRNVTKPHLVEMVMRQQNLWPNEKFSPSKTTVARLRHVLLAAGFTKEKGLVEVEDTTSAQLNTVTTSASDVLRDGDSLGIVACTLQD